MYVLEIVAVQYMFEYSYIKKCIIAHVTEHKSIQLFDRHKHIANFEQHETYHEVLWPPYNHLNANIIG